MSERLNECIKRLNKSDLFNHIYPICIEEKCKRDISEGRMKFIDSSKGLKGLEACETCSLRAEELLKNSSMFVRVRSVAFAVGFCPYAARLVELFGVQRIPLSTIPGKGSLTHKLLAVAAPRAVERTIPMVIEERVVEQSIISSIVESAVREAAERLKLDSSGYDVIEGLSQECSNIAVKLASEGVESLDEYEQMLLMNVCCRELAGALGTERVPSSLEECEELAQRFYEVAERRNVISQSIDMASKILRNAVLYASHFVLAAGWEKVIPLAEYTIYDFEYRLVGVPDFILLEPERRQAIVFEWKSSREESSSIADWERVQTLLYALLVANLLGYDTSDASSVARLMAEDILVPVLCYHTRCIPLVSRSDKILASKAAMVSAGFRHSTVKQFSIEQVEGILILAKLAAEHLVLLATAPYRGDEECIVKFRAQSGVEGREQKEYHSTLYRLIPDELRDRNLREQLRLQKVPLRPANENSSLCTKYCKNVLGLFHACKFYMQTVHELRARDERLREAWKRVRRTIDRLIRKHVEVYAPFRALYYLRSQQILDYVHRLRRRMPMTISYQPGSTTMLSTNLREPNVIKIVTNEGTSTYRFQIFRRFEVGSLEDGSMLYAARLEDALLPTIIEEVGNGRGEKRIKLAMPRRDRSIQILFLSPLHVRLNTPVAAGLTVFLRSTEVDYGDKENPAEARMELVVPSASLQFSFNMFVENLRRLSEAVGGIRVTRRDGILRFECEENCLFIAFESDVDLTYISRSVLDKLLRLYAALQESEAAELLENMGERLGLLLATILSS